MQRVSKLLVTALARESERWKVVQRREQGEKVRGQLMQLTPTSLVAVQQSHKNRQERLRNSEGEEAKYEQNTKRDHSLVHFIQLKQGREGLTDSHDRVLLLSSAQNRVQFCKSFVQVHVAPANSHSKTSVWQQIYELYSGGLREEGK